MDVFLAEAQVSVVPCWSLPGYPGHICSIYIYGVCVSIYIAPCPQVVLQDWQFVLAGHRILRFSPV